MFVPQSFQKIFSKNVIRTIACLSVFGLLLNLLPGITSSLSSEADTEATVVAQQPLTPSTDYIFVNVDGSGPSGGPCSLRDVTDPYPDVLGYKCTLAEAIAVFNAESSSDPISIIIDNDIQTINLTANTPEIERCSALIINGENQTTEGKTIIRDNNPGSNFLDYFFRLEISGSCPGENPLDVIIKNFSFVALKKSTAVAITTDDTTDASVLEGTSIGNLQIEDNNFGVSDSNTTTPSQDDEVNWAIRVMLGLPSGVGINVGVKRNIIFNTTKSGIQLGGHDCLTVVPDFLSTIVIMDNIIGTNRNRTYTESNHTDNEDWGHGIGLFGGVNAGIFTCNIPAEISGNVIGNSTSNPFVYNAGIFSQDSALNIHDNSIGQHNFDAATREALEITGFGISLSGNYLNGNFPVGSRIHHNKIANIKKLDSDSCLGAFFVGNGGRACGGTAIFMSQSNQNLIYNNELGKKDFDNDAYGIEIEGTVEEGKNEIIFHKASQNNKIFNNTISYNKADGIVIPSIVNATDLTDLDQSPCAAFILVAFLKNNCFNTISQNSMFRNGRYNDEGGPQNGGGIGIDLKSGSGSVPDNYTEQKYGTDEVTTGTNNDLDITGNDITSCPGSPCDNDTGGNGLLNFPTIFAGDDPSPSTTTTIRGNINQNSDGIPTEDPDSSYWVEVFRVRCNAEDDNSDVNETNAFTGQCDTDTRVEEVTGQGFEFLCGAYVLRSSPVWECKPEDFGNNFEGGLITSTVTAVELDEVGPSDPTIDTQLDLQYSCELNDAVLSYATACETPNLKAPTHTGKEENIIGAMGNTSEFSPVVFIAQTGASIEKQVRTCSGTDPVSCESSTFQDTVNADAGSTVEFRIDITNTGNGTANIGVDDPFFGTGLFTNCIGFNNQDVLPDSGPRPGAVGFCSFLPGGLNMSANVSPGKHFYIYFLATIPPDASGTLTNVATLQTEDCVEDDPACIADASINITPAPQDGSLVKEIILPNTDSDTSKETVASGPTTTDVNYKITLTLKGVSDIANFNLTDTFPKEIKLGTNVVYTNCQFTMQVNADPASAPVACPPTASDAAIAGAPDNTALIVWSGAAEIPLEVVPTDTLVVIVTYKGTVPANALLETDTAKTLTNTAEWRGPGVPGGLVNDTTDLTITPPVNSRVTIRHRFDTASGPATANVVSGASPVSKNYFITVDLASLPGAGLPNFLLKNDFVTTGTNLTGAMTYDTCSISYLPSTPAGFPTTCPSVLSGQVNLISGLTLPAATTAITVQYRGTVPANGVSNPNVATIINRATVDAPSLTSGVSAAASASADATLIINGEAGTPTLTLDKRADNNVTNSDRSRERVYNPGETVNYTVTVTNSGSGTASGATLRDTLANNIKTPTTSALPGSATGGFTGNNLTVNGITVPASGNATVGYRGTLRGNSDFDLDSFNLDSSADPKRDEDFYAPSDADIEEDITTANNRHTNEDDLLDIPDGKFVSLGDNGEIIIDLGEKVVVDGSDGDFGILEIDNSVDDTDKTTESYRVFVSQDGEEYTKVRDGNNTGSMDFDLSDADVTWARFIKIEDNSSAVKANAPGSDIDAICLFNIGVRLPNKAELTFNGQTLSDSENIVVDVTDVFDDQLEKSDCTEKPLPTPLPLPPAPRVTPPPTLPTTGPVGLGILGLLGLGIWVRKRN